MRRHDFLRWRGTCRSTGVRLHRHDIEPNLSGHLPVKNLTLVCVASWISCVSVADDRLDRLSSAYTAMHGVSFIFEVPNQPQGRRHYVDFTLSPDGNYAEKHYIQHQSPFGEGWQKHAKHIAYFDGDLLRQTESGGSREYTEIPFAEIAKNAPGPRQWAYCPGPVVPQMVAWFRSASDLLIVEADGVTTASMNQGSFSLSWDSSYRVTRLVYGDLSKDYAKYEFTNFKPIIPGAPELPSNRIDDLYFATGRHTPYRMNVTATIEYKPKVDLQNALKFDAAAMDLLKYDPETGDVRFPDGRLLYNRKDFEASLDDSSWWKTLRPWAFGALGIGVVVGAFFTIRRLRAG